MELHTPRLILREFRASDFDALWEYQSHPETHRFERDIPSKEEVDRFLRNVQDWARQQPRTRYIFSVTVKPDDRVIGHLHLSSQNSEINEWETGWAIHYNLWGKGYASEAACAVLDFAFGELGVHRVVAFCNVHNTASARVMQKIGMQQDGLLRGTRWWNGDWCDEYVYGILERDWEQARHSG